MSLQDMLRLKMQLGSVVIIQLSLSGDGNSTSDCQEKLGSHAKKLLYVVCTVWLILNPGSVVTTSSTDSNPDTSCNGSIVVDDTVLLPTNLLVDYGNDALPPSSSGVLEGMNINDPLNAAWTDCVGKVRKKFQTESLNVSNYVCMVVCFCGFYTDRRY